MTETIQYDDLPVIRLREIRSSDRSLIAELGTAEVEGEWNTFDDPPESMLSGANYGGGSLIVELPDETPVGVVTWIQIPTVPIDAASLGMSA